ncbi:MAG: DUF4412 domain-containing protein [Chitinophagales bacterium]|nr:DUF4412 domain-containing protein [Chitinophagales bacterium]MDW8273850.1 DUF4412 domain-containing protein [Chitinophagales bacterium]
MIQIVFLILVLCNSALLAQDYYMEYTTTTLKQKDNIVGTNKIYYKAGNTRIESQMQSPVGKFETITLILAGNKKTVYNLNPASKTYMEVSIAASSQYKDYSEKDYEITVIGNEKVNGYNATHAKIRLKDKKYEMDVWVTKDIKLYSELVNIKTGYNQPALYKALQEKGIEGMAVRMQVVERGEGVQLDLIKAEKQNHPSHLFSLDGYSKSVSLDFSNPENMIKQLQNMTPDQQRQFEEHLKNLYDPKN